MADEYSVYETDLDDAEPFPIEIDTAENVNLIERLGASNMRPRLWTFEPGDQLSYHYHEQQEELFYVVEGTGHVLVGEDGARIEVPEGGFFRPEPTTPRQIRNDSDERTVWLMIGAPDVVEAQIWNDYDEEGYPTEDGEFADLSEFF